MEPISANADTPVRSELRVDDSSGGIDKGFPFQSPRWNSASEK
jgi:hypothetical protein